MKQMIQVGAWAVVMVVIVYACVHPDAAVLLHNPLACLGVGLIGLGLFVHAKRADQRQAAEASASPQGE